MPTTTTTPQFFTGATIALDSTAAALRGPSRRLHEPASSRPPGSRTPLLRFTLGLLLILQGLAHAAAGVWASSHVSAWLATPAWLAAMLGFMAAGFGMWGAVPERRRWRQLVIVGAGGSLTLLLVGTPGVPLFSIGLLVDLALAIGVLEWASDEEPPTMPPRRLRARVGALLAALCLAWVGTIIVLRPWHVRWGATQEERMLPLPGDDLVPGATYRMDHVISIAAPADSVWPWLAQMGQDRGGFYSYAWLERAFGVDVQNAERVHAEWQERRVGELVRAVQPGYLGIFGAPLGWRVREFAPPRALVLETWGAFVVRQMPDGTTRLHSRLLGDGRPSIPGVVFGPVNVLAFEPAHFIMERGMLRGIRTRAERMMVDSRRGAAGARGASVHSSLAARE